MGFFNNINDIPIAAGSQKVPNDVIHKIHLYDKWYYFKAIDIDKANAGLDPVADKNRFFDCRKCVFIHLCLDKPGVIVRPDNIPACEARYDGTEYDCEQVFLDASNGIL